MNLDDAQGAAQPKAPTFEVSHAFAFTAANTVVQVLPGLPAALHDISAAVSANVPDNAGECHSLRTSGVSCRNSALPKRFS